MVIYSLLIVFNILGATLYKKTNSKPLKVIIFFIMVTATSLIGGLRNHNVGTDTQGYIYRFYSINQSSSSIFSFREEPLFILLNKIAYFIYSHHFTILFLSNFITVSLIFATYTKFSGMLSMSVLLYFASYQYYESFNGMRQYIAIAIVFFSIRYVFSRKPLKFILTITIAFGFHNTAILMLILYPVYWLAKEGSVKKLVILIIGAIISMFFIKYILEVIELILPQYGNYIENITDDSGGVRNAVISLFLLLLSFLIMTINSNKLDKKTWFYVLITVFYFATSIYLFRINSNLAQRIGWYFAVFIPLLIPSLLDYVEEKNHRLILQYFIIITFVNLHYYMLFKNMHKVLPYTIDI